MAKLMDSLKRFFTMEEDSFAADGFDSDSVEEREAQQRPGLRNAVSPPRHPRPDPVNPVWLEEDAPIWWDYPRPASKRLWS